MEPVQQIQPHRLSRAEAPYLYEALMYAVGSACLLIASIIVMMQINVPVGLGVFILSIMSIVMGGRAVLKHHGAQDQVRQDEEEDYQRRLANLIRNKSSDRGYTSDHR